MCLTLYVAAPTPLSPAAVEEALGPDSPIRAAAFRDDQAPPAAFATRDRRALLTLGATIDDGIGCGCLFLGETAEADRAFAALRGLARRALDDAGEDETTPRPALLGVWSGDEPLAAGTFIRLGPSDLRADMGLFDEVIEGRPILLGLGADAAGDT